MLVLPRSTIGRKIIGRLARQLGFCSHHSGTQKCLHIRMSWRGVGSGFRFFFGLLLVSHLLVGCKTLETSDLPKLDSTENSLAGSQEASVDTTGRLNSELMRDGIAYLKKNELEKASLVFRAQLKLSPQNPLAHFFNGYAYHLKAKYGDEQNLGLALMGYRSTVRFDPANFLAHHYKGLVELALKDYQSAQGSFASAAMLHPEDPRPLYGLSVSAYYNRDIETAVVAIEKTLALKPNNPLYLRTGSIIMAAANKPDTANALAARLAALKGNDSRDAKYVRSRITDWGNLYRSVAQGGASSSSKLPGTTSDTPEVPASRVGTPVAPAEAFPGDKHGATAPSPSEGATTSDGSAKTLKTPKPPTPPLPPGSARVRVSVSEGLTEESSTAPQVKKVEGGAVHSEAAKSATPDHETDASKGVPLDIPKSREVQDPTYQPPDFKNPYDETLNPTFTKLANTDIQSQILREASQPKPLDSANQMVAIDVVIMIAEEEVSEGYGVNLLNGLSLMFGGSNGNPDTNLYSYGKNISKVVANRTTSASYGLSIASSTALADGTTAAVNYSLNIANVLGNRTEVLARPTLTAASGKQASFISGNDIVVAGTSDYSLAGPFHLGVKLVVTPTLLRDGKVSLNIQASKKNTLDQDASTTFSSALYTSNTELQTTVSMNLGDTLILGGLSERDETIASDRVPFLGDIPILQYLFHRRTNQQYRKSVIFLVTPRNPDFTYMNAMGGADATMSTASVQAMLELKNRFTDWFKPDPNIKMAFKHFQNIGIYREFRNGDALTENWNDLEKVLDDVQTISGESLMLEQ